MLNLSEKLVEVRGLILLVCSDDEATFTTVWEKPQGKLAKSIIFSAL